MNGKGTVFHIQRYSIHDGPGIRTVVFLKGCSCRCFWCHNPEGITPTIEPEYSRDKCVGCGRCVAACPTGALTLKEGYLCLNRAKCTDCLTCATACQMGALTPSASIMTVEEVAQAFLEDLSAYRDSGGGITISGGEPFLQADFCRKLLQLAKEHAIHTAVETSGNVRWNCIEPSLPYIDLFLYDLKHMEDGAHKQATGVSNRLILENARKLAHCSCDTGYSFEISFRVPVIPKVNDSLDNLLETASFVKELAKRELTLLPYHNLGAYKYEQLGLSYPAQGITPMDKAAMELLQTAVNQFLKGEQ